MASNCLSSALSLVNLTDVVRSSPGQVRDSRGWTVLHMAARHSKPQTVRLVISQGGRLGEKDQAGNTPLHLAVRKHTHGSHQSEWGSVVVPDLGDATPAFL